MSVYYLPSGLFGPKADSNMFNLTRNALKCCPRVRGVMALSTLLTETLSPWWMKRSSPHILIVRFHRDKILDSKHKPLQRYVVPIFDHNDNFLNVALDNSQIAANEYNTVKGAHRYHLSSHSLECAGNIVVQGWMARLEHGRIILLASNEQVLWIDLADVEDRVCRNFDWRERVREYKGMGDIESH